MHHQSENGKCCTWNSPTFIDDDEVMATESLRQEIRFEAFFQRPYPVSSTGEKTATTVFFSHANFDEIMLFDMENLIPLFCYECSSDIVESADHAADYLDMG